jgi:hypothetical protein
VTVDRRGLVVGGANPTTLAAYGITDAYTQAEADERFQHKLGYVPVRQGTGVNQGGNRVDLGWDKDGRGMRISVDNNDLGTLWYSSNFDPNRKADRGTTLAAYGITDAYTQVQTNQLLNQKANTADVYHKAYVDGRLADRPLRDSIIHVGLASSDIKAPYMRHESSGQICWLQTQLPFTPVRQGSGPGQGTNIIHIGHGGAGPRIAVDNTDFGDLITDQNLPHKVAGIGLSNVGSYAFARAVNAPGQMNQGFLISGSQLIYSSTRATDGSTGNSGLIGVGTWRLHGAVSGGERSLWQRVG